MGDYDKQLLEVLQKRDFKKAIIVILLYHPAKKFTSTSISEIISQFMADNKLKPEKRVVYSIRLYFGVLKKSKFSKFLNLSKTKPTVYSVTDDITLAQAYKLSDIKLSDTSDISDISDNMDGYSDLTTVENEPIDKFEASETDPPNNFQQNIAEMAINQLKNLPNITFTGPVTITINLK